MELKWLKWCRQGIWTLDCLIDYYDRIPATTSFQQLRVERRGETRKITALSAPYTRPDFRRLLTAAGSSAAAGVSGSSSQDHLLLSSSFRKCTELKTFVLSNCWLWCRLGVYSKVINFGLGAWKEWSQTLEDKRSANSQDTLLFCAFRRLRSSGSLRWVNLL